MVIYGLCVCIGGIAIGLGLGGILNATSYYKGYEDGCEAGAKEMHDEFLQLEAERRMP